MFEKLKEYGLYIVLSLIALGALAYAFLSTSNAQKGGEVVSKIQDELVTAIAKNQKVKDKTTIVDHIQDLDGLTIGSYKLVTTHASAPKVLVLNVQGDDEVVAGTTSGTYLDKTDGELNLIFMTNKKIGSSDKINFKLSKGKLNNGANVETANLKDHNEQLRGFIATGYVGFGTFANEETAKEFRDSFFSTGMLVKDTASKYAVMIEIAR